MAAARKTATNAAAVEQERIRRILAAREGYDEERIRHKFLLDAYSGTGGFQGRARQPFAGFWGAAAEIYSASSLLDAYSDPEAGLDTYLDRFPREDVEKFKRRAATAHYPNYIAPAIDVPLSFLFRREMTREPAQDGALEKWMLDANGAGDPWAKVLREVVALRAMILGWCPVLLSMPAAKRLRVGKDGSPYRTHADDLEEGRMPRALPLFPSNILEWFADDEGVVRLVKTRVDYSHRSLTDPLATCEKRSRVTVWVREDGELPQDAPSVFWYDISWDGQVARVSDEGTARHGFVDIPIVIARRKPVPDEPMRGIPHAGNASDEMRRLFNLLSEVDHHLRSSTFAFLQYPVKSGTKVGSIKLGAGNALPINEESRQDFKFVSPDGAVCAAYEARIAKTIEEIYRTQKMEFTRGTTQAQSGTARSFEFESTNRMIADIALQVASFDEQVRRLVYRALKQSQRGSDEERKIRTVAQSRFDVTEMLKELEETQMAVDLGLGPTATLHIKKRIAFGLLPNLTDEERDKVESELAQVIADEEEAKKQATAAEQAARDALLNGDAGRSPFGDEDDNEVAPPKKKPPKKKPPAKRTGKASPPS